MRDVEEARQNIPSLTESQLRAVARAVKAVEKALGTPQDIEWAIDAAQQDDEGVVLLQSRPETVWSQQEDDGTARQELRDGYRRRAWHASVAAGVARNASTAKSRGEDIMTAAGTFSKSLRAEITARVRGLARALSLLQPLSG